MVHTGIGIGFVIIVACQLPMAVVFGNNITRHIDSWEARLLDYLLEKHDRHRKVLRPLLNYTSPIDVYFGMRVIKIDLKEEENILELSTWLRYKWQDQNLNWHPEDFNGIENVIFPHSQAWLPDIALTNTADTSNKERLTDVSLQNNGKIFWSPHRVYRSACLVDLTNYPFDDHVCEMWFQSLSHSNDKMRLLKYGPSPSFDLDTFLGAFKESAKWEVVQNETFKVDIPRDKGAALMYSRRNALLFRLILRRRPGFTGFLLLLPCIFLSCLTLVIFTLPPDRPDRHAIATSLYASFVVLLLVLVQTAPPSAASLPKLSVFYAVSMGFIMVSIVLSAIVVNISTKWVTGHPVPQWVNVIFVTGLGRILCVTESTKRTDHSDIQESKSEANECMHPLRDTESADVNMHMHYSTDVSLQQMMSKYLSLTERRLGRLEKLALSGPPRGQGDNYIETLKQDWRLLAKIMDRFFFLAYMFAICISIALLCPRP